MPWVRVGTIRTGRPAHGLDRLYVRRTDATMGKDQGMLRVYADNKTH